MYCLVCGKIFNIKRTLRTLFKEDLSFICISCKKKYKPSLVTQIIPKLNGVFKITSFFYEDNNIKIEIFYKDIINWFKDCNKDLTKDNYLLWLDKIDLKLIDLLEGANGNFHILTNKIFHI